MVHAKWAEGRAHCHLRDRPTRHTTNVQVNNSVRWEIRIKILKGEKAMRRRRGRQGT